MNKETLVLEVEKSTNELLEALSAFTNEQINHSASNGGWSAAQIAEHLLLAEASCLQAITAPGSGSTRPPAEKLPMIQLIMEDATTNRISPPNFLPVSPPIEVAQLLRQLQAHREIIKEAIKNVEISEASLQVKHPGFGTLTKLEWSYFIIYHSNRHLHQILALVPLA